VTYLARLVEWGIRRPAYAAAVVLTVGYLLWPAHHHAAATSRNAAPTVSAAPSPAPERVGPTPTASPPSPATRPAAPTMTAVWRVARAFAGPYLNPRLTPPQRAAAARPYVTAAYDVALTVNPPLPLPPGPTVYRVTDSAPDGAHISITRGRAALLLTLTTTEGLRVDGATALPGD
jgi:hypothetical protein